MASYTAILAEGLNALGQKVVSSHVFDTLLVETGERTDATRPVLASYPLGFLANLSNVCAGMLLMTYALWVFDPVRPSWQPGLARGPLTIVPGTAEFTVEFLDAKGSVLDKAIWPRPDAQTSKETSP